MLLGKVLSIQSHVVHGYVGNRAAVFPLQLLGFDVDFINSVQFSNHTGYKNLKGQRLSSSELNDLFEGLKLNNLANFTHLLTGYARDAAYLNKLADIANELKQNNPNLVYLCDPVLGDHGDWYVPKELLPIYKERLLPIADIITPNAFELEQIYGKKIENVDQIIEAIDECHRIGVKTVIISSIDIGDSQDKLYLYASSKFESKKYKIEFSKIPGLYYGTGDTFAALFLAWFTKLNDLKSACEHAVSIMLHILKRTYDLNKDEPKDENKSTDFTEIQIIRSKNDIENPEIIAKAVVL